MSAYVALLSCSSSLHVASLPFRVLFHGNLAFDGLANAALPSLLALCYPPHPHHAGIITSIALVLLLSPALQRRHCPCRASTCALVALALAPSLHPHCCQHCKRRLPSHNAVAADIPLLLLPVLHRHYFPHRAGIFALFHPHCYQHDKLAFAQSQCSYNTLPVRHCYCAC